MRGKLIFPNSNPQQYRITPADAGKTPKVSGNITGTADHPRGCGENLCGTCAGKKEAGSPPRMRGKPSIDEIFNINRRDHPRGCGENLEYVGNVCSETGSPPRMRGKQSGVLKLINYHRITPADAGKTLFETFPRVIVQDHPRGCGENLIW